MTMTLSPGLCLMLALYLAEESRAGAREASAQPSTEAVVIDSFSADTEPDGLPRGWRPMLFSKRGRRTSYSVERKGADFFVVARSSAAGAGILKPVDLSVQDYPILSWRWKIRSTVKTADIMRRRRDDYAARVYVAFRYDPKKASFVERLRHQAARAAFGDPVPKAALIYVWDNTHPVGSMYENAFTGRAKMVVVESGDAKAGKWVLERRNVYEDYRKAFNAEPPPLSFIALMTDTNNTRESTMPATTTSS